jgi:hypothetical protein
LAAALPTLDAPAATALGLVALAGGSRAEAASTAGLAETEVGPALARARKALRRLVVPLPGSGWCERAELMVSDRLDGALTSPGPQRLAAHLRNCPRCVEHERRLVQATDELVAGFGRLQPATPPERDPKPQVEPALSVVRRSVGPAVRPFGVPVRPAPRRAAPEVGRPRAALAWSILFAMSVVLLLVALAILAAELV